MSTGKYVVLCIHTLPHTSNCLPSSSNTLTESPENAHTGHFCEHGFAASNSRRRCHSSASSPLLVWPSPLGFCPGIQPLRHCQDVLEELRSSASAGCPDSVGMIDDGWFY